MWTEGLARAFIGTSRRSDAPARVFPPRATMDRYLRALRFAAQTLRLVRARPGLLGPLLVGMVTALPLEVGFGIGLGVSLGGPLQFHVAAAALISLLLISHLSAAMSCSMVYDHLKHGDGRLGTAIDRMVIARGGLCVNAFGWLLFEPLAESGWNPERPLGRAFGWLARHLWTPAPFALLALLVVDSRGLVDSIRSSRELAEKDPTGRPSSHVAVGLLTYAMALLAPAAGYGLFYLLSNLPIFAAVMALLFVGTAWLLLIHWLAVYWTCFFVWSEECTARVPRDPSLAPPPLRPLMKA